MPPPVVYSEQYALHWPGHVFPTAKYRRLAEAVLQEGLAEEFHRPDPVTWDELAVAHDPDYLSRLKDIADGREPLDPRFECPVTWSVLDAFRFGTGGTILAARLALDRGVAVNLSGGFHHAYAGRGGGFCLLNDVPVAAKLLLGEDPERRIMVVDLDVHQGNGTAVMARDEARIFTLSVHQQSNYPPKEVSDLDVGLPDLAGDALYLDSVGTALRRAADIHEPDLVFYLAGGDPFVADRLGGLAVTKEGLAARDRLVLDWAAGCGAAVVCLLAGGYAEDESDLVDIHLAMVREALSRL